MKISLIIPAYNEEKIIADTLRFCHSRLAHSFTDYQLIAVDDGSGDNTLREAKRIPNTDVISYPQNRGKGFALRRGMDAADGDAIFFTDADLPYGLGYIQPALHILYSGADLVTGSRDNQRTGYTPVRKLLSRGCHGLQQVVLSSGLSDTQCGFKGMSRRFVQSIAPMLQIDGFGFDMELLYLAQKYNMNIQPLPVTMQTFRRDSRVRCISDSLKIIADMLKIKYFDKTGTYREKHHAI